MRKLLFRVSTLSSAIYFHLFSSLFSSHGKTSLCKGHRDLQMLSFGRNIFCFQVKLTKAFGFESSDGTGT
jgi:hypothetical protein